MTVLLYLSRRRWWHVGRAQSLNVARYQMMFIVNATDTVRPVLSQSQQHRLLSIVIAPPPPLHVARRHLYPSLFAGTVVEGMYSNQ